MQSPIPPLTSLPHPTPIGAGSTQRYGPKRPCTNVCLYPQDPGNVHPVQWMDGTSFDEMLHCVSCYTHQHEPHTRRVGRQEEYLQDVLRLEFGCVRVIRIRIRRGLLDLHCIAIIKGSDGQYEMLSPPLLLLVCHQNSDNVG